MTKQLLLLSLIVCFTLKPADVANTSSLAPAEPMMTMISPELKTALMQLHQKLENLTPEQQKNIQGLANSLEGLKSGKLALVRLDAPFADILAYVTEQAQNLTPEEKDLFIKKAIMKVSLTPLKGMLEALTPAQKQNLQGLINSVNALGTGSMGLVRLDPALNPIYSYVKDKIQSLTPEQKRMYTHFVVLKIIKQKIKDLTPAQKQNLTGLINSLQALSAGRPGLVRMTDPALNDIYGLVRNQLQTMTPEHKQMFVQMLREFVQNRLSETEPAEATMVSGTVILPQ